jgi:hypothetical protein
MLQTQGALIDNRWVNNPNHQEGGGRLKAVWGRVRTDGLAATVVGTAATLAGLGLEEASAATAALSGGLAGVGVLFGIIAVVRLRRKLNKEERDRQNREVQKLKEAALGPKERQLAAFAEIVKEQGKSNDRTAKKYFWLGILVSGAIAVLVDVFAHFIPTVKLSNKCRDAGPG